MFSKSGKRVVILLILLFIVIFIVGVSYAYTHANFFNVENSTTIAVNGGKMEIIYNDPETGGYSSNITAVGVIPGWETTKLFTVTGTNEIDSNQTVDTNMYYKVGLVVEENTFSVGALKYEITPDNGEEIPTGQVLSKLTGNVPQTGTEWFGMGYFVPSVDAIVHKYELKISFPETGENQNIDKGKHFAGYVTITDEGERVNLNVIVDNDNPASNYNKTLLKNSGIFLETPVKEGYAFMGWNVVSGNATVEGNKLIVYEEQNIQIEATWESNIKVVTLILELDGGETSDSLNQSVNSYSLIDLRVPTKEDHIFLGWELVQGTADINGNYIQLKASNVVLKAKWRLGFKDFEFIAVTTENPSPYHEFIVPESANYMIELWGAQGKDFENFIGGAGSYVKGEIFLNKNQTLDFYIGEKVNTLTKNAAYNGGGKGNFACYDHFNGASWFNGTGGGATDVRIISGVWNNSQGVASRIMVAGGGSGATHNFNGATAGGLSGYNGGYYGSSSYIGIGVRRLPVEELTVVLELVEMPRIMLVLYVLIILEVAVAAVIMVVVDLKPALIRIKQRLVVVGLHIFQAILDVLP